jgi:hypothetical protein
MMRALVEKSLEGAQRTRHLSGALSAFLEVLAIDSSVVRVTPKLAAQWPRAFAHHSPAAVKLTAVTNVVGRDLRRLRMVPGSRHDIHLLEVGSWMIDRLIVFDLGFYSAKVFQHIDGQGGYFLCRLRKAANPFIIESYANGRDESVGFRLKEWPHDRWSRLFSSIAHDLLRICSRRNVRALARDLWFYLETEAPDPNRNRALLAERSSMGVCAFA